MNAPLPKETTWNWAGNADFTWTGGAPFLGPSLARHVKNAEDAGINRISVMDHFWQIRGVGPAETEMLEAYTLLGFL
jgi:alkanesulfonate monooxygenase